MPNQNYKKNYIICTPTFSKSAGVKVLHKLADLLIEKGYTVYLFSYAPYKKGYTYINKITDNMRKNDIVVYPEIIKGNPLRFQNVARYVMYFASKLGGDKFFHHSEKIFLYETCLNYYNPHYKSDVSELYIPVLDMDLFYNDNRPKKHNSYFVYKGGQCRLVPEIKDAIRIDMKFPEKREDLAELLRNTDILYSYDGHSALLDEARLCGAKVKIITEHEIKDFTKELRLEEMLEEQIKNFITITQKMNYTGKIEKRKHSLSKNIFYKFKILLGRITNNSARIYKYQLK